MTSLCAYSSASISAKAFGGLMQHLNAQADHLGYVLRRQNAQLYIELAEHDILVVPDSILSRVEALLESPARSRVVFMFAGNDPAGLDARMARAVAIAIAERWPVVLDDYNETAERIRPPGFEPPSSN